MKKIFTVVFSIISFVSLAQNYSIEGSVVEQNERQPLEFSTIAVYNSKDDKLISGNVSDEKGKFSVKDLKEGSYYLTVQFLGYNTAKLPNLVLEKGKSLNVGTISLAANEKLLEEVVVQGEKASNIHKIDKQVYKASQFQSSQGGTAIDVLKNTPSVSVNAEGEISMRGASGFLVLIDGRPVQVSAADILNQIPANSIQNIEIITSPSAKYDPDGKAGIINITTRQGTVDAFSLTVNVQGGLPAIYTYNNLENPQRYGADATLNWKRKKWDVNIGGNYTRSDVAGRRVGDVNTTIGNVFTSFPSDGERSFIKYNYTGRASVTFTPDKNNSFSAGIYKGYRSQSRRADILYHNTKTDLNTGNILSEITYFNSNVLKKTSDITLGNLEYTHTFSNKSTLSVSGLYEHAHLNGHVVNLNQNYPEVSEVLQNTINPSKNPLDGFRLKTDYGIKIDSGKLDIGYQFRNQTQKGNFEYLLENLSTGEFFIYPDFSSSTEIINKIHSLYTQYSGKKGKLEYVAGLRYEYATREFTAGNTATRNLNLSNLFPSANVQYSFNPKLRAKAGYSKRVQRSTNNELNPFPEREHSETLEQGDPDILPEFIDLTELGLIKDFSIGNVFATVYNQRIKNVVNRVNNVYNDSILNRIYTNAGRATLWGLEAGTTLKPVKWWQIYLGGNVYDYQIKGALFNNDVKVNSSSWVYSINTNTSFQITPSLTFQWNVNYLSERVTAQGKDSRFVIPNSSIKKTFLKGKLSAMVQWQNMDLGVLGTNKQRITTQGKNFYTTTNYIQETDIFLINISYNLNQLSKKAKLPSSEFGEREF